MDWDTAKAIGVGLLTFMFIPVPFLLLMVFFRKVLVRDDK